MPKKSWSKKKKIWLIGLGAILVAITIAATVFIAYLSYSDSDRAESYIGLSEADAFAKAEAEGLQAVTIRQSVRDKVPKAGNVGLILYTDKGVVVDVETQPERKDPRVSTYLGLSEADAVKKAESEGLRYAVINESEKFNVGYREITELILITTDGRVVDVYFNDSKHY